MFTKAIRKSIAVAAVFMAVPATALAIPPGGGNNPPPPSPPVAKFTISPNPAIVSSNPTLHQRTVGIAQPVALQSGDAVKFDASGSSAQAGIDSYRWDLGTGTYTDGSKIETKRFYSTGSFTIRLEVVDQNGHGAFRTETLIVHRAPRAVLSADNAAVLVGQTVTYSAAGSTGDPGLTGSYDWDLDGNGTFEKTTTTPTASTSYSTLGTRTVHVRVTDTYGKTATTSLDEVVHRAPTAAFTIDPNPATAGQQATFDGSSSTDDDPIAKYEWDLDGDGTFETDTGTTPTAKMTFPAAGTSTIRLRVTDDHGVQDVVSHTLTVNPAATTTTTTTTTTTDTTAPKVRIATSSAKLSHKGFVTLKITCPKGESTCAGRLALRSLRGAKSSALGGVMFHLAGGQSKKVRVHLSAANRRTVKRLHKLRAQATATVKDAAGNAGTSHRVVLIHR